MSIYEFEVPPGYKLVRVKTRKNQEVESRRHPRERGPKVFPPNIRQAIEIATCIVRRITAKEKAEADKNK